jgi:hypothetical protein
MTTEPTDAALPPAEALSPPSPLLLALAALEGEIDALIAILDEETAAAMAGRGQRLEACYTRKLALAASLEARNEALRSLAGATPADELAAILTPARREALAGAQARLRQALARNEAGLRAATEAVRRIFESAAKMLASEGLGYGPSRLPGEGHLFRPRTA